MSREDKARAGAQAVIGDAEDVLDVAVVEPRGSTLAGVLGAGVGSATGGDNALAWGVAGSVLGQRANAASRGSFPSIVLAVTPTRLHLLGRKSSGLVGGWKSLQPVAQIDRANLEVRDRTHNTVHVIELTDCSTGKTLEFEGMHVGNLGVKDLLERLRG